MISSDVFNSTGSLYLNDKKDKFLRIIVIVTVHCGIPASSLLMTGTSSLKPCFHVHVHVLLLHSSCRTIKQTRKSRQSLI